MASPPREGNPAVVVAGSEKIRRDKPGRSPRFQDLNVIAHSVWEWMRAHPRGYGD